ncbi:MAG: ATP-binding protein [Aliishimia sp.]
MDASEFVTILDGDAIELIEGEYVIGKGIYPQTSEWVRHENPYIDHENRTGQSWGEYRAMTGRFRVERSAIGTGPMAIHLIGMRGNFSVSVNGVEVFRNYATTTDQKNPWYRPFLIPVSEDVLQSDANEILIHSFSRKSVGIGRLMVGSNQALVAYHRSRFFWHITAPIAANFTMLVLGFLVLSLWFARRHETELLWLSITVGFWFIRNHSYYAEDIPFDAALYASLTVCMTYFAIAGCAAFYFYFIKLKYRWMITAIMLAFGAVISALFVGTSLSSALIYFATTMVIISVAIVAIYDLLHHRTIERGVLGVGVLLMPFASVHDVIMLNLYEGNGHATYIAVFCGAVFAAAFIISFGKRVLTAFESLGQSNLVLEQSIAQTRADLMESEAIRRELQVTQALTGERTRLMQEMHDGIGSNLTAALAVARQQQHPPKTITVLKRALGDLKLTVDSLEPIEGDVVALIGNLRHRMARDLADAGISCKWEVGDCDELTWLDAANALHVLRIHNEAISNVLSHSHATEMRIGCKEEEHESQPGISTYVIDNGDGFDTDHEQNGKGLLSMQSRAISLHGNLDFESRLGQGTTIKLWLPYVR